jgi:hypothetical protein
VCGWVVIGAQARILGQRSKKKKIELTIPKDIGHKPAGQGEQRALKGREVEEGQESTSVMGKAGPEGCMAENIYRYNIWVYRIN